MTEAWPALPDGSRLALREILIHGVLSRAEIARSLGLSRASLTRAMRILVSQRLVVEVGTDVRGATGRPSELLQVSSGQWEFLGIKLTKDRLYAAVTDLGGRVLALHEEAIDDTAAEPLAEQIMAVLVRLRDAHPAICAIGVSLPGDVMVRAGESVVAASVFLGWHEVPFARMLEERTGIATFTANDVHALTAKEHWFGAGAGRGSMVLVTVGEGLGLGLIANGQVSTGEHGRLGRIGHLPVLGGGPDCGLGHAGCASSYLPSPVIVRNAGHEGKTYDQVVELARDGDEAALAAFEDAGRALGVLLATAVHIADPSAIVLTGDGLPVYDLARATVDESMRAALAPYTEPVTVEVQPFEFSEWARAGAVLAIRRLLGE
ncbi:ROK family transcriptional regulator [Curtobacterium flaccumfaciens pv. flaccumfaciens]|jgi:predicted NBD/HSP70 family sugar kinase|uniref:ROK family transcriptional regulator n=1 Tax=Curtobacterium flaccumfaciens TaxID=2035 RepID=UPI001ADA3255|nr:ROK family transcriptional regulator [Curtobacterium flaccumfaciens]MBO9047139.1 ROK family transcriptional regulator [Curtobacterium flaccumfaciens pv. flaccumfaciens]MBO9057782.1 ROK family transcriptional regulator [Curtobacterium flaccumfaciens pv. flaccumfaciens]QTR92003.1 ROK family transcriptional regulator [Curtobacterium flaccumfaciens pv. flaccumfaciens]QVG67309.1 ROK family transcriptional regulator [Curtobacterium flaccumfaciens pv. flaccumfaciens]